MKSKAIPNAAPKTDAECQQEADRLAGEIRQMLDNARRTSENSKHIGAENRRLLHQLEQQLMGDNSRPFNATNANQVPSNQLLQQRIEQQSELHKQEMEILELRLRLHISEELRRLKTPTQ